MKNNVLDLSSYQGPCKNCIILAICRSKMKMSCKVEIEEITLVFMYLLFQFRLVPKCKLIKEFIAKWKDPEVKRRIIDTFIYLGDINLIKQLVNNSSKIESSYLRVTIKNYSESNENVYATIRES